MDSINCCGDLNTAPPVRPTPLGDTLVLTANGHYNQGEQVFVNYAFDNYHFFETGYVIPNNPRDFIVSPFQILFEDDPHLKFKLQVLKKHLRFNESGTETLQKIFKLPVKGGMPEEMMAFLAVKYSSRQELEKQTLPSLVPVANEIVIVLKDTIAHYEEKFKAIPPPDQLTPNQRLCRQLMEIEIDNTKIVTKKFEEWKAELLKKGKKKRDMGDEL